MNQSDTKQSHEEDVIENTLRDAGSIGKVWARYGLLAGKGALETSALTLGKVAGILNNLAASFKEESETIEVKAETVEVKAETVEVKAETVEVVDEKEPVESSEKPA